MKLKLYNKKRNFAKTPEPKGKVSHQYKNLFVIQKHAASHLHYDFRLELNGILLSWAVPKGPSLDPSVKRLAMHVEDHPVEYGLFEGIIPKGQYGGGTVLLWDTGTWICENDDAVKAYRKGHLNFVLKAKKLKGRWSLIRIKSDKGKSWLLIKAQDKYARSLQANDITKTAPNSVLSKKNIAEIAAQYEEVWIAGGAQKVKKKVVKVSKNRSQLQKIKINLSPKPFPKRISPQLATLVKEAPSGLDWLHEIKLDGYRILAFKDQNKVFLYSRNQLEWTKHFPNVVQKLAELPVKKAIFDGEMVLLDEDGHTHFQLLQNSIKSQLPQAFIYYIFDLIYYDQYDLQKLSLLERKNILRQIIPNQDPTLRYSDHIIGSGAEVFKKACELGLEGIICKNVNSNYTQKRTKNWLKVKCSHRQEFVICGFTKPERSRQYFGSLYLGVYDKNKKLIYCGNVGTGFNKASLKNIYQQLQKYKTSKNPFDTHPPGVTTAIWLKPVLVAEVEFSEWTADHSLRHPSFKRLRTDKPAHKIVREKIVTIKNKIPKLIKTKKPQLSFNISHPDKLLYPENKITKQALAQYYDAIEKWILPYIINRPLTLVRCPENYKRCFYQKHLKTAKIAGLYTIPIKTKRATEEYIYIKDRAGLMALVQMGVLEIHPWGSRIENLEYPDMMTFDLDPAAELSWKKVVAAAFLVKKQLTSLKLKSFVKTTGGKGLHIVVPIEPKHTWDEVKDFAHLFVQLLVSKYPQDYVSQMSKAKRKGKIFIDYLRNTRGATSVSAYSTRARIYAPVSVPLAWSELSDNSKDNYFTISNLAKRLEKLSKDPWRDFFKIKQTLKKGRS